MSSIILSSLNARYIHCAFGLRYLQANMGDLQSHTNIMEFVITQRPMDIVEALLNFKPKIIGLGVFIWNSAQIAQVVALLKQISPETVVVLGGPEVSHELDQQDMVNQADYVITGWGDLAFPALCQDLLHNRKIENKIINGTDTTRLSDIQLPYDYYTDEDISHRVIYVEASRGCPYKCEFCLSALDKTLWSFDIDNFLQHMQKLYDRGARKFKFVDRTFNLKIDTCIRILEFFLQRLDEDLFLHFELVPDFLPDKLKSILSRFPPACLQFEVGIQTLNIDVQKLISRKQNNQRSLENLQWLRQQTGAHIHADLIIGLPGEDMESFANGFNRLWQAEPHEIQLGILKRLRGSTITRYTGPYQMRYNPYPPYNILSTNLLDFTTMQRLSRFARYWDLIANSGHFKHSLSLILEGDAFSRFLQLSDWIFAETAQTHKFALARLFDLLFIGLTEQLQVEDTVARHRLWQDFQQTGIKKTPAFKPAGSPPLKLKSAPAKTGKLSKRQVKHLQGMQTR